MSKARKYLAKYEALSNAAEFIRSHGEEGFAYKDEAFDDEYQKATKALASQLSARADKFIAKYRETGGKVDNSVDDDASYF